MEAVRINRYLAECGVCSRREADKLIEAGKVTVNGVTAALGTIVGVFDEVAVDGKPVGELKRKVVLAYYKPAGVICTERDRHAEKKLSDLVHYPVRLTYAGRLDKDSEGLLLLTNDGDLINALMRGENRHEKEYVVKVDREITREFLEGMEKGVFLPELGRTTRPCRTEEMGKYTFRIVLTQGLNRQIRRMCEAFGFHVKRLQRVRVGNVSLGDVKCGEYRELAGEELEALYKSVGMEQPVLGDILKRKAREKARQRSI